MPPIKKLKRRSLWERLKGFHKKMTGPYSERPTTIDPRYKGKNREIMEGIAREHEQRKKKKKRN